LKVTTQLLEAVGRRIRERRIAVGLVLEQLAARSGVSTGALSQLERGVGNPSLGSLIQVAHALGTTVPMLLDIAPATSPLVRREERRRITLHDGDQEGATSHDGDQEGATYELLTPDLGRLLEVIWVETEPANTTEGTPYVHAGQEVGVVIEGVSEVHVGDETHLLRAGDAISYLSTTSHWFRNPSSKRNKIIQVITPPTW
jgi:transcriptional regulator with XRE-family HTH domain